MADRPRARLRTVAVGWSLVQKLADRAGRIRSPNLLRCRDRIRLYSALRSHLVSRASQAAWESTPIVLRPSLDRPLFTDDDRRLERMASWRRLVWSFAGDYDFSDSTRAERCVVGDFLWTALPRPGPHRDHPALGCNSRQRNFVLENLNVFRCAPPALSRVGHLCYIFECRNLALESSSFSFITRNATGSILFHSSLRFGLSDNYLSNPGNLESLAETTLLRQG